MGGMSVDMPDMDELLQLKPPARYGDEDYRDADGSPSASRVGGSRHLSAVLPAVCAAIGHPTPTLVHREPESLRRTLGLPNAESAVVVLVDGLGYWNIRMRIGHAPYLRSLLNDSSNTLPISTCSPSTTVAALATFGTGTCPGLTGMTGYTQLNPQTGQIAQLIQFNNSIGPDELQRQPTLFEALGAQGVRVTTSGLPKFAASALTKAALRGTDYVSNVSPRDRVRAACQAARTPGLTYLYLRDLDKVGHSRGWDSNEWTATFERVDSLLGSLKRSLPKGALMVIVADHGMISAVEGERIDVAETPELMEGVALVGGEPRAPMLYTAAGQDPSVVARRWQMVLGEQALALTRDEAIGAGIYGSVDPRVKPMIGDVVVFAAKSTTIVDTRAQSEKATRLPSVHGSRSSLEMDIPCLIDVA